MFAIKEFDLQLLAIFLFENLKSSLMQENQN